ncbi:uncharacterized protein LOC129594006 [Paramacrobiotus metropolitanus]|uniref:uncharacterized protein LOC129594006 n=1 Tax=Paramacrobiotus metropolitanus TaxID=2943436 RepID=UPI002445ABF1|nr:uncharacterized protein LOC129594006 [Paramacrobiotus metropolitanus]XP_055346528.1 uncharacterized protein LOC129594006 [Paramacrobiotus metropolitanus]
MQIVFTVQGHRSFIIGGTDSEVPIIWEAAVLDHRLDSASNNEPNHPLPVNESTPADCVRKELNIFYELSSGLDKRLYSLGLEPFYLGGSKFKIYGIDFDAINNPSESIRCRVADRVVQGIRRERGAVQCIIPPLIYTINFSFQLEISLNNGLTFPYKIWLSTATGDFYSGPPMIYNSHLSASHSSNVAEQLWWYPNGLDLFNEETVAALTIAVDFVGWYMSDNKLRVMVLPLTPSAPNSGNIQFNLTEINFGTMDDSAILLKGCFRVIRASERDLLVTSNDSLSFQTIWSAFVDASIFERLRRSHPDAPDVVSTLYKENAEKVLGMPVGSSTLSLSHISPKDIANNCSFNVHCSNRLSMIKETGECSLAADFCACWLQMERKLARPGSDVCSAAPCCPPNDMHAWLNRRRFTVFRPDSSVVCHNQSDTHNIFWPAGDCLQNIGASLCVLDSGPFQDYRQECCYGRNGKLLSADSPGAWWAKLNGLLKDIATWPYRKTLYYKILFEMEQSILNTFPLRKCRATEKGDRLSNSNSGRFIQQRGIRDFCCVVRPDSHWTPKSD